jgi:hypothetical protein
MKTNEAFNSEMTEARYYKEQVVVKGTQLEVSKKLGVKKKIES